MTKRIRGKTRNKKGEIDGFSSDLERAISQANGRVPHSKVKVRYVARPKTYNPDFTFCFTKDDGSTKLLLIEAKGVLTSDERTKYKSIKSCYASIAKDLGVSEVELVFLFANGHMRLTQANTASQTYLEWCEAQGFRAATGPYFPDEWFDL